MTSERTGSPLKVAYLGPKGSFSHQATLQLNTFNQSRPVEIIPHPTIPSLFSAIKSGSVDRSVVPLANSTNGPVQTTLELLAQASLEGLLEICGETSVLVRQCLVGRKRHHEDFLYISSLHTHPQAWTQCSPFLNKHFDKPVKRIDEDSTSAAAELVSKDESGNSAAICSALAAEVFGLEILAASIQEEQDNRTRFLVLKRKDQVNGEIQMQHENGQLNRSLIAISAPEEHLPWTRHATELLSQSEPSSSVYSLQTEHIYWLFVFRQLTVGDGHDPQTEELKQDLSSENIRYWEWSRWTETANNHVSTN